MKQNSDKHINDLKLQVIQMVTQLQHKEDVIEIYDQLKGMNLNNRNNFKNKKNNNNYQNSQNTKSNEQNDIEIEEYILEFMDGWDFEPLLKQKIDNKDIQAYNFMMKNKSILKKHNEEIKNQRPEPEPDNNYWDYD